MKIRSKSLLQVDHADPAKRIDGVAGGMMMEVAARMPIVSYRVP